VWLWRNVSLGRGMVPVIGMDPGEYCTWGFCNLAVRKFTKSQVQYSPGSIPIPGTIPLPRGGLLTWTYLLICTLGISKRISTRKHINTSILVTMTRKTPNQKTRVPSPCTPCMLSAWLCNPGCLHQAHPV